MSIDLSELLSPECIELNLSGKRKPEIIRELVQVVSRCKGITDTDALYRGLMEREKLSSTGIGDGIALPHCMTPLVNTTHIAFGRKLEGAKFDSLDNQPVTLFFLLVGPDNDPSLHLRVLSKLARYLRHKTFCSSLLVAESPAEVIEAFRNRENP